MKVQYNGREWEVIDVPFDTFHEGWNEYSLHDGTVLRAKLVAAQIFRIPGEWDADGNPLYILKSQNILSVRALEALRKPETTTEYPRTEP